MSTPSSMHIIRGQRETTVTSCHILPSTNSNGSNYSFVSQLFVSISLCLIILIPYMDDLLLVLHQPWLDHHHPLRNAPSCCKDWSKDLHRPFCCGYLSRTTVPCLLPESLNSRRVTSGTPFWNSVGWLRLILWKLVHLSCQHLAEGVWSQSWRRVGFIAGWRSWTDTLDVLTEMLLCYATC